MQIKKYQKSGLSKSIIIVSILLTIGLPLISLSPFLYKLHSIQQKDEKIIKIAGELALLEDMRQLLNQGSEFKERLAELEEKVTKIRDLQDRVKKLENRKK